MKMKTGMETWRTERDGTTVAPNDCLVIYTSSCDYDGNDIIYQANPRRHYIRILIRSVISDEVLNATNVQWRVRRSVSSFIELRVELA